MDRADAALSTADPGRGTRRDVDGDGLHLSPDRPPRLSRHRALTPSRAETLHSGFKATKYGPQAKRNRSEEHTSELQSLMRTSYAVFCLKNKKNKHTTTKSSNATNTYNMQ